jgi:cell division protein FtsA
MEGVTELAEEIFHMPVRIGAPVNVKGLSDIVNNPIYSTGVGLLHFGVQQQRKDGFMDRSNRKKQTNSTLEKIKSWFQGGV